MSRYVDKDEERLLDALSSLAKLGPIEASGGGPNVVGKILQDKLGIRHSTTKRNTLFNYTVTSTSARLNSGGRTNLFACVPDWKSSVLKSSKELVEKLGREDLSRGYARSLFCTTTSHGPNGFGLFLKVDPDKRTLEEWAGSSGGERLVVWDVARLEKKLASLGKTAIVTALPIDINGKKAFQYRYVDLLGLPEISSFLDLLENGSITIDHCISIKLGKTAAREQGPLFKVRAQAREELYRDVKRIDLMNL
jgi:hypothetical protein